MTSSQEQDVGAPSLKAAAAWAKPAERGGKSALPVELLVQIVVLAGLFSLRFFHVLYSLWNRWRDPNWSHSYLVPLFSLWFLYIRRHKLKNLPLKRSWTGIVILVIGMVIEFWAMFFLRFDYGRYMGLLVSVFGLVLFLGGWGLMRHAWVSVLFLIFMMPVPASIYERAASPLQELAARASVTTLNVCQIDAKRRGTVIQIPMPVKDKEGNPVLDMTGKPLIKIEPLNVAEACAGLRLLVAFIALGVAFAYLSDKPVWQRLVLIGSTVPIAVFCNMVRVSGTGLLFRFVHRDMAKGFYHEFAGWVMLLVAMAILFGLSSLMGKFTHASDKSTYSAKAPGAGRS